MEQYKEAVSQEINVYYKWLQIVFHQALLTGFYE